ncbi:MAG TPA: UpxY family transcription antiterminator [Bacteroidales bacterium]
MNKTWFALYVKSRWEKKVGISMEEHGIDYYLPLIRQLKQWSDRKKWVEEPLFKSYIFVNIEEKQYYEVLQVPGVVRYITFEKKAVPIREQQIEAIKYFLNEKEPEFDTEQKWEKGRQVEVISGSMTGLIGQLVDVKGKHKVSITIDAINRTLLIQIPKTKLRII